MHHGQACAAILSLALAAPAFQAGSRSMVAERVKELTRAAPWKLAASVPLAFAVHHPQGMVKIGETYFVSSVEIKVRTRRLAPPVGGYDRDAGEGIGHLFKIDGKGNLVADLRLGAGTVYHPGGIDYDGRHLWVPVAEYRPNSRSIVYRVDPITMEATEIFRFDDHLGALACNPDDNTLHGVSWGSRRFYRWTVDANGRMANARPRARPNPSHYVDYQDCKYAGDGRMLCTGVTELRGAPGAGAFRLGGIDLIDLEAGRPIHQVPVPLWTAGGLVMTQNPVWLESTATGLRAYFMPEDDKSTIYIYEVETAAPPR